MKGAIKWLVLILMTTGSAMSVAAQTGVKRPRLVVGLVIDQMRWDYLYRYYERYGTGGFRRLLGKGYSCEAAYIPYVPTFTAPGHACVYTGSVPAINGMAGNDWMEKEGTPIYCTADDTARSVGGSAAAGRMSPRNLWTTTITDELRLATRLRSRVFALALKDRGAIIPGGHLANGAYWYDDSTGRFISSSHYGPVLPDWLQSFNAANSNIPTDWNLLYPADTYRQSLPDSNRYEGATRGGTRTFPHIIAPGSTTGFGAIRYTPAGNAITLDCATACLKAEGLGKSKGVTDFLAISLSSPDYIGHLYGPEAMEVEDMYLRLDAALADFLTMLDKEIGKGEYLLFLTADHGAAHNSEYMRDLRIPAGNSRETSFLAGIRAFAAKELTSAGGAKLIHGLDNYSVYLDREMLTDVNEGRTISRLRSYLLAQEGVTDVVDMDSPADLLRVVQPIRDMLVAGHNRERSGRLHVFMKPGWYAGYMQTGTTHGSWHPDDAHIPLLWYGWHIPAGRAARTVHMTDISATLAALLHIQVPNGCVGEAISEVIKD